MLDEVLLKNGGDLEGNRERIFVSRSGKYIVGIDLGTTNCTLAYVEAQIKGAPIEQLAISQIVERGMEGEGYSLPSFIYLPLQEELASKCFGVSWDTERPFCVGQYARDRGCEMVDRLIASPKSWLCHYGIDRREAILPLSEGAIESKMSPCRAIEELLRHLMEAWNGKFPEEPFVEQEILITVPASFDPSARQLVQEAAEAAGYPEVILLEEPQAAFYSWLSKRGEEWRSDLSVGDTILVVDIGGGTTDFSLISVADKEGDLALERVAVGSHLLLGGDNIDLSLAYLAKEKLEEEGHEIDEWQLRSLQQSCRIVKEELLSGRSDSAVVTVVGRGSSLIGGTLTTTLSRQEVDAIVLEGFFPLINPEERARSERLSGMQQVGLPYAADPRISAQLAKFLSMTGEEESSSMENFVYPSALLFNGGTMKGEALCQRVVDLLNRWGEAAGNGPVKLLTGGDLDFAVSRGAAYYGIARGGDAIRIRGGTSCSYFIGVEDAVPAVPGREPPLKALCVVPFGMEEGTERELTGREFSLLLGEEARFRFFSHHTKLLADGTEPMVGSVVTRWKKELKELHPIETLLERGDDDAKTVRVVLRSKVTELGVLELFCCAADGREWKLEFDLRGEKKAC